jgi:hypothetical protein
MFQYMTFERPQHLNAVLRRERRIARQLGRSDQTEASRDVLE